MGRQADISRSQCHSADQPITPCDGRTVGRAFWLRPCKRAQLFFKPIKFDRIKYIFYIHHITPSSALKSANLHNSIVTVVEQIKTEISYSEFSTCQRHRAPPIVRSDASMSRHPVKKHSISLQIPLFLLQTGFGA